MKQTIKSLQDSINQERAKLHLTLTTQLLTTPTDSLADADQVWLPLVDVRLLPPATITALQGQQLVVNSLHDKYFLIDHGHAGKKITVCPLWQSGFQRVDAPAPYSPQSYALAVTDETPAEVIISHLNRIGGIGVIDCQKIKQSYQQLLIYLTAGLPIGIPRTNPLSEIIQTFHLGPVLDSPKMLSNLTFNQTEYNLWEANLRTINKLIANNYFVRAALLQGAQQAFADANTAHRPQRFDFHILDSSATLDYIDQHHCSVARLGDGEISLLNGASQVFQDDQPDLRKRLDEIVKGGSDDHLLVCLSDTFHDLDRYTPQTQDWWKGHINTFHDYYRDLGTRQNFYGNTMVTRPYIDLQDRTAAGKIFQRIRRWWNQRDLLIVEGIYTRSGVNNDLYQNASSIQRILCPPKNAWDKHQAIEEAIKHYGQGKLVLVMLGMAATVIAADLADWGQVIDIGHLDSEYEWYRMGATKRVPIIGKHTAEMNYDQGVPQHLDNQQYRSQIILNLA